MTERRRSEVPQTALGFGVTRDVSPACDGSEHCPAYDDFHRPGCYQRPGMQDGFAVEIGKPLPNGAVVVAAEPNGEYVVVLAVRGGEHAAQPRYGFSERSVQHTAPYVTWKVDPDTGNAFWGDYLDDFDEAVANYKERVAS